MYYILFIISNVYTVSLSNYFESLVSVVTSMSSLLFPLYYSLGIEFQNQLSQSFALNCLCIISAFVLFMMLRKLTIHRAIWLYIKEYVKYKLIAKYTMWNACFMYFCMLIEIESTIYTFGLVVSLLFTILCVFISIMHFYCFILNNHNDCFLCNKFQWLKTIKSEFVIIKTSDKKNYDYFIAYNWTRKILFALMMSLFYKFNYSPYFYAFTSIPLQIMYFCLSFVVLTFHSSAKGFMYVINEPIMTIVVSMATIVYMNTKSNDIGYMANFIDLMLICVRLQILGTIAVEVTTILMNQGMIALNKLSQLRIKKASH